MCIMATKIYLHHALADFFLGPCFLPDVPCGARPESKPCVPWMLGMVSESPVATQKHVLCLDQNMDVEKQSGQSSLE